MDQEIERQEKLLKLFEWYQRDGSVGGLSQVMEDVGYYEWEKNNKIRSAGC